MTTETILTDEQITEEARKLYGSLATDQEQRLARAIEQAVLQSPEVQALRQRVDDMEKIVAECRDAMPIPNVGSKAEKCWPEAMSDAEGVPDFIRASIEAWKEDSGRIDWIARQDLDDICFSVIQDAPDDGMYCVNAGRGPFVGDTFRAAVDAAMERRP